MFQAIKRSYLFFFLLFLVNSSQGQSFSLNCTRDTLVPGCPANFCFTLKGRVPDIRKQTSSYTINPTSTTPGCFPVYVAPNNPQGTPTNLTIDDTYSPLITIGFPFSFYGTVYMFCLLHVRNSLVCLKFTRITHTAYSVQYLHIQ